MQGSTKEGRFANHRLTFAWRPLDGREWEFQSVEIPFKKNPEKDD
jgi:hypothetical protein